MAPTKFKDFNKAAKDLLTKDYSLNGASVEFNSTAQDGTSFKGTASRASEKINAGLEVGHSLGRGLKLTEAWTSSGSLNNKLEYSQIKNFKLTGEVLVKTGDMSSALTLSAAYTNPKLNFNAKLSPSMGISVDASTAPAAGVLVGVSSGYNTASGNVVMPTLVASYARKDWSFVGNLNLAKGTVVTADSHHKVNSAFHVATNVKYNVDKSAMVMAAGVQYKISKNHFYKAKVDSNGVLAASITQNVTDGVKFTLGAELGAFSGNSNRVGAALVFNQ